MYLSNSLQVTLSKIPPPERGVTFSWHSYNLQKNSEVLLEITWLPTLEGSWCDVILLEVSPRLRKDVSVVFKSIPVKVNFHTYSMYLIIVMKILLQKVGRSKAKTAKPSTVLASKIRTSPKNKSPTYKTTFRPSPRRRPLPNITNTLSARPVTPPNRKHFLLDDKENFSLPRSNANEYRDAFVFAPHRGTYTLAKGDVVRLQSIFESDKENKLGSTDRFCDSLENNITPLSSPRLQKQNTSTPIVNITYQVDAPFEKSPNKLANISTDTYVKGNLSATTYTQHNLTPATYTQHNLTPATYTKHNSSTDTYVRQTEATYLPKHNVSCSTYIQDDSLEAIAQIRDLSPISTKPTTACDVSPTWNKSAARHISLTGENARRIIEADLWSTDRKCPVPSSSHRLQSPMKRRCDVVVMVSPPKRVKTVSAEWSLREFIDQPIRANPSPVKRLAERSTIFQNPDTVVCAVRDPFVLMSSNIDPFMSSSMYYDSRWLDEQEVGTSGGHS